MAKTILTSLQRKALTILTANRQFSEVFYLSGDTAIVQYYLQHRLSEDLDFFSEQEIDQLWLTSISKRLKKALGAESVDAQQSFNRNLVFLTIRDTVLKTEFTYFPFQQIETPTLFNGLRVDSLMDCAVNKFFTIYQKPAAHHFIDLFLLIQKKGVSWDNLSKFARIKFNTVIDPLQLGSQLITAKNIADMPRMLIRLPEHEWRDFFVQKALDLKSAIEQ